MAISRNSSSRMCRPDGCVTILNFGHIGLKRNRPVNLVHTACDLVQIGGLKRATNSYQSGIFLLFISANCGKQHIPSLSKVVGNVNRIGKSIDGMTVVTNADRALEECLIFDGRSLD